MKADYSRLSKVLASSYSHLVLCAMLLVVYAVSPRPAVSAELITNGGFETGNFNGWTVTNVVGNIWFNWTVSGPNCGGCVSQWTNAERP